MSTTENPGTDIESGRRRRRRSGRRRLASVAGSSETTTDGSHCFSDEDDDDELSWHSPLESTAGGSFDECGFSEIEGVLDPRSRSESFGSDCFLENIDLESGGDLDLKAHYVKEQRDCRICHLNLVGGDAEQESGIAIELGCFCKGDLAAAHKQCADTWFKIRGNTTCEICGATARNVVGEQTNEADGSNATTTAAPAGPAILSESRNFWHGRRVMNVLLACMVFAFVISWFFHFKVLS